MYIPFKGKLREEIGSRMGIAGIGIAYIYIERYIYIYIYIYIHTGIIIIIISSDTLVRGRLSGAVNPVELLCTIAVCLRGRTYTGQ